MKKKIVLLLSSLAVVSMLAGCSPKEAGPSDPSAQTTQEESASSETQEQEGEKGSTMDLSTTIGTIHEIKDMSFVIKTDEGTEYLLSFEEKPEGLDSVQDSDRVKVTYGGGRLSEVDPFTGIIVSVEKAE